MQHGIMVISLNVNVSMDPQIKLVKHRVLPYFKHTYNIQRTLVCIPLATYFYGLIILLYTKTGGPWSEPIVIFSNRTGTILTQSDDTNLAGLILDNGTFVGMFRCSHCG